MSDKQREDHTQAKYWNGFITRVEAQKVFDETAQVIRNQAIVMQKFDAVITCIAEKVGVTPADVNEWIQNKVKQTQVPQVPVYECLCGSKDGKHQQTCAAGNKRKREEAAQTEVVKETSPIVLTD